MNKIRLKSVCLLGPLVNKKIQGKVGSFLPMEQVNVGTFNIEKTLPYEQMSSGYTFMENGDVIRAIVTPCFENNKGALVEGLTNGFAFGSSEFMCLRPKKINPQFLYYVTISNNFKNYAIKSMKGVGGLKRINSKYSLTYVINNYSEITQSKIVKFLDANILKIDQEINLLETKLLKLKEFKEALIYETVTKGLNKTSFKNSQISWIGQIPSHWEILPFKKCLKQREGKNQNKLKAIITENVLSVMKDVGVINYKDKGNIGNKMSEDISNYKLVYPNDIVINKMNVTIGSLGISKEFGALSVVYMVFKETIGNNNEYYNYLFKNTKWQKYLRTMASGILEIRESVNTSKFLSQLLIKPPLSEQNEIVSFLNKKCLQIETITNLTKTKIKLMKEYKESLICETIDGKNLEIL